MSRILITSTMDLPTDRENATRTDINCDIRHQLESGVDTSERVKQPPRSLCGRSLTKKHAVLFGGEVLSTPTFRK